jgi:hypothetical protein
MNPTLWTYQSGERWAGHIDWHDGRQPKREGPFKSEATAAVVISRMNGKQPPDDMLRRWNAEMRDENPAWENQTS